MYRKLAFKLLPHTILDVLIIVPNVPHYHLLSCITAKNRRKICYRYFVRFSQAFNALPLFFIVLNSVGINKSKIYWISAFKYIHYNIHFKFDLRKEEMCKKECIAFSMKSWTIMNILLYGHLMHCRIWL